ncbi:MAG: Gfo/Idh/MocA family oxidoreductase [bacterium]
MKTYNVGIIGFGFIGKVHAYGHINMPLFYDNLPFRAKITHVCTSRISSAEAGRDVIGADFATTDFREITENPDIDIVHICSPNNKHKDALLSAMAQQKNIYCDKPLVVNMEEAAEIAASLPAYRGIAQMTLQNRFFPATMRAKQLMDEGFIGTPLEFRASYLHAGSADPKAPLKWKLNGDAGGGVIADLASHIMDLMHYLLGDYSEIFATTKIAYPQRPSVDNPNVMVPVNAEDCVMMLARMANGALGNIEATKIATGTEDELRFEIHGSQGALRFNTMDAHHLEVFDARVSDAPIGGMRGWTVVDTGQRYPKPGGSLPSPKNAIGWMRSHMACLYNFMSSVYAGIPAEPGLQQGIYIQRLMECVRQSNVSNSWEKV